MLTLWIVGITLTVFAGLGLASAADDPSVSSRVVNSTIREPSRRRPAIPWLPIPDTASNILPLFFDWRRCPRQIRSTEHSDSCVAAICGAFRGDGPTLPIAFSCKTFSEKSIYLLGKNALN